MIPDIVIEKAAHAILHAEHPEASGWSGKPESVKERYRRMARAALEAAEPEADGFVGVCCEDGGCFVGGYYPPGCWTPVDDDGREFVYVGRHWLCAEHAEERAAAKRATEETPDV